MILSKRAETEAVVLAVLLERPYSRHRGSGLSGTAFRREVTARGGSLTVLSEAVASLRGQGLQVDSWKQGNQSTWRLKPCDEAVQQWFRTWESVLERTGALVDGVRAAQVQRTEAPARPRRPWDQTEGRAPARALRSWDRDDPPPPPLAAHERAPRS